MAESKIAVITPYYKEPTEILWQCHQSVMSQGLPITHFMVADGHPNPNVASWNVQHVVLPTSHNDNGNTPRGIGALLAQSSGFEFVAYLDADNWYEETHLQSLLDLHNSHGVEVCCSFRNYYDLEGNLMAGVREQDEDACTHVDTSCFLIHKSAFRSAYVWTSMPKELAPICDRIFYYGLKHARYKIGHSRRRTVAFRSQYAFHYQLAGRPIPVGAKTSVGALPMKWLLTLEGVKTCQSELLFVPV